MEKDTAVLNRQALALFNFMGMRHENDKHIGELTLGDFVEICAFLAELEAGDAKNQ
jgi:hypothetical protein